MLLASTLAAQSLLNPTFVSRTDTVNYPLAYKWDRKDGGPIGDDSSRVWRSTEGGAVNISWSCWRDTVGIVIPTVIPIISQRLPYNLDLTNRRFQIVVTYRITRCLTKVPHMGVDLEALLGGPAIIFRSYLASEPVDRQVRSCVTLHIPLATCDWTTVVDTIVLPGVLWKHGVQSWYLQMITWTEGSIKFLQVYDITFSNTRPLTVYRRPDEKLTWSMFLLNGQICNPQKMEDYRKESRLILH